MQILLVGMNHKTAPVELRERFHFPLTKMEEPLKALGSIPGVSDRVILSTCNRVELYSQIDDAEVRIKDIKGFLSEHHSIPVQEFEEHLYYSLDSGAVKHIFCVTSSLDSMIVGEPQILGQVKEAFEAAKELGTTGLVFNNLFQKAFSVAKKVRTDTGIAKSAVSVGYAAVELAKKIFGELSDKTVLLIGAGEMSETAARHLVAQGVRAVFVANRTYERAQALARELDGSAIRFDSLAEEIKRVDIVISSTGAPHFLLKKSDLQAAIKARKNKPIFLIDIGVPRNIEPAVNDIENVYLYDIDDLENVVRANKEEREKEALKAEAMIEKEVAEFMKWYQSLDVVPTIMSLRQKFERIRAEEVERIMCKFSDLTERERELVQFLSDSLTNKFLHEPTVGLRRLDDIKEEGANIVRLVRHLFNLDQPGK